MQQSQTNVSKGSDPSTVEEILDTDKFIASVRKHFGLTKEKRTVCEHCGEQLYKMDDGRCANCGNTAQGQGKMIWVETDNKLMNKRGVESFVTTLRTNVDRNQISSNFDRKEIKSIMEDFHKKWAMEISREWDNYGVKNKPQAHKIVRDGSNVIWALYKRAQDGDTLDMIGGISSDVSKTIREQNNDENTGIGLS